MVKVGVITWFKYHNYGTLLQAVALQKYLLSEGYDPELINFEINDSKNNIKMKKYSIYERYCGILLRLAHFIYKNEIKNRNKEMDSFVINNCKVSKFISNDSDYINVCNSYDYIVFGSDQIWNPNWYHPYYFGAKKGIMSEYVAYAPSIGIHEIDKDMFSIYKENLKRFKCIGMREKYAVDIISNMVDKKVFNVIDPVFLLNKSEWLKYQNCDKVPKVDYILCYLLSDNSVHWKAIKKYARRKNLKLVVIPVGGASFFKTKYTIAGCNINDFIGLINNASEVITDSFHGTAFSLILNKKFRVFERHNPNKLNSQNDRIYNILNICNLNCDGVLIKYNSGIIVDNTTLNYEIINHRLDKVIIQSKKYLNDSLSNRKD